MLLFKKNRVPPAEVAFLEDQRKNRLQIVQIGKRMNTPIQSRSNPPVSSSIIDSTQDDNDDLIEP